MVDCANCIEKCPQAAAANEIAKGRMFAEREFINLINKIENGTLVEVVRCKDCKHWSRMCGESYLGEPGLGKCRNARFFAFDYGFETEDNFTCADGERKKEGTSDGETDRERLQCV